MSLTFGLNTWSLWGMERGKQSFELGSWAAPQVPWASVLVRWSRLPWSDRAPSASFIRSKCGSRTEGWSGSAWRGQPISPMGRTVRMGTLPPLQVQSEILQEKKKTKDWALTNDPHPNPNFNLLPLSQGSLSTLHSDSWIESCPGFLGALKFLESSVQHYSVFSSPFPRASLPTVLMESII